MWSAEGLECSIWSEETCGWSLCAEESPSLSLSSEEGDNGGPRVLDTAECEFSPVQT